MFRTGWNVQIALLVTQALRKNKYKKIPVIFFIFFCGLFCLRHNLNIRKLGSFKLSSEIELGQSVPTAYHSLTLSSKLSGHETLNFSQKTEMKFPEEIDKTLCKKWRGMWKRGGRSGSLSTRNTCRLLAVVWAVRKQEKQARWNLRK